jgi:hypothetical protein
MGGREVMMTPDQVVLLKHAEKVVAALAEDRDALPPGRDMDQRDEIVECDEGCEALEHPASLEELVVAYLHWRSHSYLNGCSHAFC